MHWRDWDTEMELVSIVSLREFHNAMAIHMGDQHRNLECAVGAYWVSYTETGDGGYWRWKGEESKEGGNSRLQTSKPF